MDGLNSRGQVVLIGATNKIDSIDGALRRPGRFDREFIFSFNPHKKVKESFIRGIKNRISSSFLGYNGADLKALCTEAAINAFREKYPQVYTSDDKFVIDLDYVKVEKHDFFEAMPTIIFKITKRQPPL
ncbi:hypothetical protein SUGI_0681760 [Cryptomeria japonica]|nr:hypothetical protein SUGI_0681760 [Cryptomeria japonica]